MTEQDAISQAIATALTTASPTAAAYLLRGAELLSEKAASERQARWITLGILAACVIGLAVYAPQLAHLLTGGF